MDACHSVKAKVVFVATAALSLVLLSGAGEVRAQRGGEGESGARDRGRGQREERAAGGNGYEDRGQGWRNENAAPDARQDGDGEDAYTTRRGGSVDTDTTREGDTTTRDTTVTDADGQSATHTGSATTDGDRTVYHGQSSTSTGRDSDATRAVTKTDDGFVARGAAVDDRGAAGGTVVKDGDHVDGRSVDVNGDTVSRNSIACDHGDCNRTTVATDDRAPYGPADPNFVPYSSYPCSSGADMVPSASGDIVYSCSTTPMVTTTVPLTGVVGADGAPTASAQVSSAAVVMYQVSPDTVVYVTSYEPRGVYCINSNGRYYWVPGAAAASQDVADAINAATNMEQPTSNATVITYTIGNNVIYLTDRAPLHGIYSQSADRLYAWMPGVTQPTDAQRGAIGTSVTVHGQTGARALAGQAQRAGARGPS